MKTFLGIGLGPIQTGIFLLGAAKGGFDKIVVADVDEKIVSALRKDNHEITINVAGADRIWSETISNVEIFNPTVPKDLETLIEIAAEAVEIATALPGVKFFQHVAPWLKKGFEKAPEHRRFIYTAENHNHAAELLEEAVGQKFPNTYYLNTVIGKMSGVVSATECEQRKLLRLSPSADRGHLVEEFNKILISSCPGIEERKTVGLHVKSNLLPFEEAKLYGHNAVHFMLGIKAQQKGIKFMSYLRHEPEILESGLYAFTEECGEALIRKWKGINDPLFTYDGFKAYAEDLIERMTNPFLNDQTDRICRDIERKLGWNDRVIGTIRLAYSQGIIPASFVEIARIAFTIVFGNNLNGCRSSLRELWRKENATEAEIETLLGLLFQ